MKLQNKNILLFSIEPWSEIWYSKHHWAYELSKKNKVLFFNSPQRWSIKNLFKPNFKAKKYSKNIKVIDYSNIFPFSSFSYFSTINELLLSKSLKKWLKKEGINEFIIWSFDPYRFTQPKLLKPILSIFYITDLFQNKNDKTIVKNSDFVFSVNKALAEQHKQYKKNILIIPHGISKTKTPPIKTKNQMILMGTFTDRVNLNLLAKLSQALPKTKIILYGPQNFRNKKNSLLFKQIINKENIVYLGYGNLDKIETELLDSKIALAMYYDNNVANRLNSLKIIQYLSYGKNIVSSFFKDYDKAHKQGLLKMTDNNDDFINQCATILENEADQTLIKKRIDYASDFLYTNLLTNIEEYLTNQTNPSL